MYRIGEFARLGAVSVRTLRHYDELGLLRPAQVDPDTGYRAYEARQLSRLNRLIALKELGFGLSEAARLLDEVSEGELRGMLQLRRAELEQRIVEDRARLAKVEARLRIIEQEDEMPDDVSVRSLPAQRVAAIVRSAPGFGHENLSRLLGLAFRDLNRALERSAVQARRPYFTCYSGDPEDGTLIAYACAPIPDDVECVAEPAEVLVVPAVPAAAVIVREGTAEQVYANSRVYAELMKWLEAHGYVPVGAGRDVYVDDHDTCPGDPSVFEIRLPIRRLEEPPPDLSPQPLRAISKRPSPRR